MNLIPADKVDWVAQYDALQTRAGLVELGHRTRIEVAGADRATWLHNLCTNEIRKLASGTGCEAFLTTVQGKTLGHVFLFVGPETIVIDTVAGEADKILKHLDRYLVCEQVTLTDRSQAWSELLLAGADSARPLAKLSDIPLPTGRLAHGICQLAQRPVEVRQVDWAGPLGYLLSVNNDNLAVVRAALIEAGAVPCDDPAFEAARIENGVPLYGVDLDDKNLPQEIARDPLAISFVKGCYLGQETVARIDALGHVNKSLLGLRFKGPAVPERGLELLAAGQPAGSVTSAAYSPRYGTAVALGYVRRGHTTPGTLLDSDLGVVEVVALPMR
jgi:folate-binding protein YgfZ